MICYGYSKHNSIAFTDTVPCGHRLVYIRHGITCLEEEGGRQLRENTGAFLISRGDSNIIFHTN